ncbi:D-lyxose/D-mannose family sugar isomerase [Oscillospiraceae bacterium PP1C4]
MITKEQYVNAQKKAIKFFEKAHIAITDEEKQRIEVVDFNLGHIDRMGLEILVYVNTQKVCAKELVVLPGQSCAEHMHPTVNGVSGKEETFRCRWGKVYLYVSGPATENIQAKMNPDLEGNVTVFHEIVLNPGEQHILYPETLHWFQAGPEGAIVSEFSTTNTDEMDVFTDQRITRFTKVQDE